MCANNLKNRCSQQNFRHTVARKRFVFLVLFLIFPRVFMTLPSLQWRESLWFHAAHWISRFLIGCILHCRGLQSSYLPVSPLMVFMAMTVVGAMPPKLKLQSFIFHELEFVCFSKSTRMPVFTMAMSSSRRRACLKANTYSCYRN